MTSRFLRNWMAAGLATLVVAGCGSREGVNSSGAKSVEAAYGDRSGGAAPGSSAPTGVALASSPATPSPALPRKIIYTAEISLVVKDLSQAEAGLRQLLKQHQGFIASSDLSGTPGSPRSGTWTVRVPVERFEAFQSGAVALGELQSTRTDSQDVTAEFYDVAARLKNKKAEEARLLRHLDRSTARLEDILAVEREISRVRGEIEQMEGQIRLLSNQTELTTITLNLSEVRSFAPAERTSFLARVSRTFGSSIEAMSQAAAGMVLVVVALLPWLLVAVLVGLPFYLWARRRREVRASGNGSR